MSGPGAPVGNKNNTKNRPVTDLIRRALLADDSAKARKLADTLVDKAIEGDVPAIREVLDRTDGKVPQALEHMGEDGGPIILKFDSIDAGA